jgi:copper chaperone CopZ
MDDSVTTESTELSIEGMSCDRCVARVEAALREVPGVESVEAAIGRARVLYQPEFASRVELGRRIERLGYRVVGADGPGRRGLAGWLHRMALSNARAFGNARLDCCTVGRKKTDAP